MNINNVLAEYDSLFGNTTLDKIEDYLYQKICEAVGEQDEGAIITLLNEMIGLCRDTSQKEKALAYCEQLKSLLVRMNLEGTQDYATSMQNIANAYRAFGLWEDAEEAFRAIEKTYEAYLAKGDYLWASMYNNWGLLYQEKQEYGKSVATLQKALSLIVQIPNQEIKEAITKTNLANSLFGLQRDEAMEEGYAYLCEALNVFVEDGEKDFHYGAALVAMGDYCVYNHQWKKAKAYYRKGLVEILIHTGKTEFYSRVTEKYKNVVSKMSESSKWQSNLEQSKAFYDLSRRCSLNLNAACENILWLRKRKLGGTSAKQCTEYFSKIFINLVKRFYKLTAHLIFKTINNTCKFHLGFFKILDLNRHFIISCFNLSILFNCTNMNRTK